MINVNRNIAIKQLQELVEVNFKNNLNYMSEDFNNKQKQALEMFQQRIFLEEVIDNTISFNKSLNWNNTNKFLNLTKTAEDLIDVFKLRSNVYSKIGYNNEFPDMIENLNFDYYDKDSAIIYYKNNNKITGTIKVIFDNDNFLPSDEKYSFDYLRKDYKKLVELSRFIISNDKNGLNLEFKYLFSGVYQLSMNNNIDLILSALKQEHYKMYSKFGGIKIEAELGGYGNINLPALVLSWNPLEISNFFKKVFLNNH
jgi:N-acyl-L-homoserine lactone synthetase